MPDHAADVVVQIEQDPSLLADPEPVLAAAGVGPGEVETLTRQDSHPHTETDIDREGPRRST